jgi:hypothetical protein
MSIITNVEEQCSFGFTGRINILKKDDGQFLGVVNISEGEIVSAQYSSKHGLTALFSLVIIDMDNNDDLRFVVEPEVIPPEDIEFSLKFDAFKNKAQKFYEEHLAALKLRPPGQVRLIANPTFVKEGDKLNATEFSLLKTIVDFNKVEDIYLNSELFDFEVTHALVSLRKKKALKVISN